MNYQPNDPLASLRIAAEAAAFVASRLAGVTDLEAREDALVEALDVLHRRGVIATDEAAALANLVLDMGIA